MNRVYNTQIDNIHIMLDFGDKPSDTAIQVNSRIKEGDKVEVLGVFQLGKAWRWGDVEIENYLNKLGISH